MERLDKRIAAASQYSRREVKDLIRLGRVTVDGVRAASAEQKVAETAAIAVDGQSLTYEPYLYILLHKPAGVLTATEDRTAPTVLDLIPAPWRRKDLSPVGRLDKDTEGLLLLTDDGTLNHRLTSPRHHVDKVYYARVDAPLEEGDVAAFAAGIPLKDFTCLPARLEILSPHECRVTVQEGKFHQVRRMLAARGKPVVYLRRLTMGPLSLDDALAPGDSRKLTREEAKALYSAVGL